MREEIQAIEREGPPGNGGKNDQGGGVEVGGFARRGRVDRSKPWNVCSAALLARLLAKETGLEPGEVVWFGMDVHLYLNHIEQAREQIARKPRPFPALTIKRRAGSLFDYRIDDFELKGYDPHPPISLPIAV